MNIDELEYQQLKTELEAQRKTIEVLARLNAQFSSVLNRIRTLINEKQE